MYDIIYLNICLLLNFEYRPEKITYKFYEAIIFLHNQIIL